MKTIEFEIEGIVPIKMDRFVDETQPKTEDEYLKQAELKVYSDDKDNLIIPSLNLKASLKEAANELAGIKKGKAMRQTIRAGVFVTPDNLSLGKKKHDGIVKDLVTRKGSGDKVTRVPSFRPIIKNWKAKGTLTYCDELSFNFLRQGLDLAGLKYGIFGHRPEFGRFKVNKFLEGKK